MSCKRLFTLCGLLILATALGGMRSTSSDSPAPNVPSAPAAVSNPFRGWVSLGHPPGVTLADPFRGINADGRQELFAIGSDEQVWHAFQTSPNGDWSGWLAFPGSIASCGVVRSNADGRMELVVLGQGNIVAHTWQVAPNGIFAEGWGSFGHPQGTVNVSCPVAGQYADGRLAVFAVGYDLNVWLMSQQAPSDGWNSSWWSLGFPSGDYGAFQLGDHQLVWGMDACGKQHIFGASQSEEIYFNYNTSLTGDVWSGWIGMGHPEGVGLYPPAVGLNDDGRLEMFTMGSDDNLWHKWQVAPCSYWSGWASLGKPVLSDPAAWNPGAQIVVGRYGTPAGYALEVFVLQRVEGFWHIGQVEPSGGWGNWSRMGRPPSGIANCIFGNITKGNNADGTLVFFARGDDGAIWMNQQGASLYLPLIQR